MKLLLFDIDGTLIRSSGAGRAALKQALQELFGTTGPVDDYKMSGKTDARIVSDLLAALNFSPLEIATELPRVYAHMQQTARAIFPEHRISPCVGIPVLLQILKEREDVLLGLLTGNAAQTAPLKLAAADIDPEQFAVGAYGSDHEDRNQLPALAIERANEVGQGSFTGADTIVIGDTPADILCARAGRATAVAVATGWHAAGTLAQYHPDFLFENLADTADVVAKLVGE